MDAKRRQGGSNRSFPIGGRCATLSSRSCYASAVARGAVGLLGGSEGLLGETVYGDVLWSPDAISFRPVLRSPTDHDGETLVPTPCESGDQSSPEVAPTAATPDGFLVLIGSHTHRRTSIWPVCEPDVWISDTGATWTLGNDDLPFGAGAYVYDIALARWRLRGGGRPWPR